MAKKNISSTKLQFTLSEFFAFLLSLLYFQSVLTVAHHVSMWVHNGSLHKMQRPAAPVLVLSLILIVYSWKKQGKQAHALTVITITILACASLFWLSGLRTNFYF